MAEQPKFRNITEGLDSIYRNHIPIQIGTQTLIFARKEILKAGLRPDSYEMEQEISDEAYEKLLRSAINPHLN